MTNSYRMAPMMTPNMRKFVSDNWHPTAKSYVQDGLIAHWDGIENDGYGIHNDNAPTWRELITHLESTASGTPIWSNNSYYDDGTSNMTFTTQQINSLFSSLDNDFTVEIAFKPDCVAKTSGLGGVFSVSAVHNRACFITVNYDNKLPLTYNFYQLQSYASYYQFNVKSITYVYNPSQSRYQIYNSGVFNRNCLTDGCGRTDWSVRIGLSPHGNFVGDIYTLRIYNHALSDNDIRFNYLIDAKRFDLH